MTKHGRALRAACPVFARTIVAPGEGGSVSLRTRENVVPVRSIAAAVIDLAFFRQRSLLGKIVAAAVKLGDIFCNCYAFGIGPRAFADAVTRIFSAGTLRRQICVPGL